MAILRRQRRRLPDDAETFLAASVPEWSVLNADEQSDLADFTDLLLGKKTWEASNGFRLTDEMCATIAAQAAWMALGLGTEVYRHVKAIVVHPSTIRSRGVRPSHVGGLVMTDGPQSLLGQAHHNQGPVLLAWDAVRRDVRHPQRGSNVVIHEFAHKIDMLDGVVDGVPPLFDRDERDRWEAISDLELDLLRSPPDETETGHRRSQLINDYAATDEGEFFAVVSEVFFMKPVQLAELKPDLYSLFASYFNQDPVARR